MENSTEKSLWYLFIEGDIGAFSSLFKHFYPMLHSYGIKISGNTTLTEDCLQTFFIYLYDNRASIEKVDNVKSYLYISFRRTLLKTLKKERKFTSFEEIIDSNNNFVFSFQELLVKQETTKLKSIALLQILNELSPREKEVIFLKYYSNLKTTEIAEVMNISYQSVSNTLQKAFIKLRKTSESTALSGILKL